MTTFAGITRLVAAGFRGATSRFELRLFPEHPFVLLFGENGSGKSTLVDAIEFVLRGTKGSLGDFKSTNLKHLATLGTPSSPLRVELEAGGTRWIGSLEGNQPRLEGPETRPRVEILRRSRLAKIVAATPTERFEQLDRFVNVEGVAASEAGLERAAKDAKQRLQEASRDIADAESALRALWEESGRPAGDPITWARRVATAQADVPEKMGPNEEQRWVAEAQWALESLTGARRRAGEAKIHWEEASNALRSLDREPSAGSESGAEALIELLVAARKILAAESNENACPLCLQPVDIAALRAGIETHLRASEEQAQWLARRAAAMKRVETQQAFLERVQAEVLDAARALARQAATPPQSIEAGLAARLTAAAAEAEVATTTTSRTDDAFDSTLAGLATLLTESARARVADNERRAHIARLWKQHDLACQQGKTLEDESDRLARCLKIARAMRQEFTDNILKEVAGEVNRLYRELHPNETELGGARFYLDPKQRASLHQAVKFGHSDDLPPQACFSESHLVTLAFCLWLALAKRERPAETVLVLDDIVHAVDAPHMQRLAVLLGAERESFLQLIVTTHSRRFLRYLRDGLAPSGRLDCRILRWSLRGGIVQGPSLHAAEQLEKALSKESPDRKTVASKGGALLEAILRQLAALYRRPVPFAEPPEPALSELFNAWSLNEARCITIERSSGSTFAPVGTLGDVLGKLHGLPHIRNLLGAPTNTATGEVPDREVQDFGRCILELWRLTVCACGQIPGKEKDGAFVCHCRQSRLRPDRLDSSPGQFLLA
jgi:energy-coupling factor transporter ATP-binding protein EcfA2